MIISAESHLTRLEPRSGKSTTLVDLADKDNGGNVHFPQGMERNTVWARTLISLAEITKMDNPHLNSQRAAYRKIHVAGRIRDTLTYICAT